MNKYVNGYGVQALEADINTDGFGHLYSPRATDGGADGEGAGLSDWAVLVLMRGPHRGSRFLLDSPVTSIGRLRDCDVFLDDIAVSRRHAEIRWDSGTFSLVDVGSLNGISVNGQPIDPTAALNSGDLVQIGEMQLVFLTHPAVTTSGHHRASVGDEGKGPDIRNEARVCAQPR
ncbi:MAG: FHA domain-containing protein [Mycobacterium sp.]|nr:FHA domain-containing protein [Mycobacterium sp.]